MDAVDLNMGNYLILLDEKVQHLLKTFLQNSTLQHSERESLEKNLIKFIIEQPYPLLQILLKQWPKKSSIIKPLLITALEEYINELPNKLFDIKFTTFVMQLPQDLLNDENIWKLMDRYRNILKECPAPNNEFYLSLMSDGQTHWKRLMYDLMKDTKWRYCEGISLTKEYILYQTLECNRHFVVSLIEDIDGRLAGPLQNAALFDILLVAKLLNIFLECSKPLKDVPNVTTYLKYISCYNTMEIPATIYIQIKQKLRRWILLCDFMQTRTNCCSFITLHDIMNSTVLDAMKFCKTIPSYEDLKALIESIYENYDDKNCTNCANILECKRKELEQLSYYFAMFIVYNTIICDNYLNGEEEEQRQLNENMLMLNSLLRQIGTFENLCQLLEDIIQLLFIRREYLSTDSKRLIAVNQNISDSLYSDENFKVNMIMKRKCVKTKSNRLQIGFICRKKPLQFILNCLKSFVTKKYHSNDYKSSSSILQERFQQIVDVISHILWKQSILEQLEQSNEDKSNSKYLLLLLQLKDKEFLGTLIKYHGQTIDRSSSDDDEENENYIDDKNKRNNSSRKYLFRYFTQIRSKHKAIHKRRRATFSGTMPSSLHTNIQNQTGVLVIQTHNANETTFVEKPTFLFNSNKNQKEQNNVAIERSIIPKILYPVQQLANMALSLKQYKDAKKILEDCNLYDSNLNTVLNYVEQQQQIKNKLINIYNNYEEIQKELENSQETVTTVEQIRRVAVKGFEVSKFLSVIDNFLQSEVIKEQLKQLQQQTEQLRQQLRKYKEQQSLQHIKNNHWKILNNLNAMVTFDLILDLPLNYDITKNILSMIKRQYQYHQQYQYEEYELLHQSSTTLETKLLPNELCDCVRLLENLCDCMNLLGNKVSLKELLCNSTYSLRSEALTFELDRENIFKEVFYKSPDDLPYYADLKNLSTKFHKLKSKINYYDRFCAYICQLNKLLRLRNPNSNYRILELLETIDPYSVIGELIFTCNVTPLEIEAIVKGLNLNLIHAVAINICPEIGQRIDIIQQSLLPTKLETVLNYVDNHNHLLAYLLRGIIDGNNLPKLDDINVEYLERVIQMPEIEQISALLYNGNKVITVLLLDNIKAKIWNQIKKPWELFDLLEMDMGLQESNLAKQYRTDRLIVDLINEEPQKILLCSRVNDITLRVKLIRENFKKIPTLRQAKQLIESTLHHKNASEQLTPYLHDQLNDILIDITVYAKICDVIHYESWLQAYEYSCKSPQCLFNQLLQMHLYKLAYEWCKVIKLADNFELQQKVFLSTLSETFLQLDDDNYNEEVNALRYLQLILETFPQTVCVEFLQDHIDKFRSVQLLRYTLKFLQIHGNSNANDFIEKYENYEVSLLIFEHLSPGIRKQFWNLIKYPLLIMEMLIMNTKFELLNEILPFVRNELKLKQNDANCDGKLKLCEFCYDKRGHIYDITSNAQKSNISQRTQFQLGMSTVEVSASAFILLNFNLYQQNHHITNDCIDLLLRIYATKALDYHISNGNSESYPSPSVSHFNVSVDSTCGEFRMPSQAPHRSEWIRDEDVSLCMCCRCTFTMFVRRHHCRRCGRIVCFACSPHRMRIPELYEDVEVRICVDCHRYSIDPDESSKSNSDLDNSTEYDCIDTRNDNIPIDGHKRALAYFKWKLSGNITHDKLLREEFCYEHAPSVALCLSILDYHIGKEKCVELLLYHCRKLEKLIIPNPEVDYELVAKMMNCLALAAKVRGAPAEVETLRLHSEIIISVVQSGCESYIPPDLLISKLADSLVQSEHWELALEVNLKCGLPTTGVMAAHGLACLRAGCFETAREKFSHCMPKLTNLATNAQLYKLIFGPVLRSNNDSGNDGSNILRKYADIEIIKRPSNSPALMKEILELIKSLPITKPQPETLLRASIIRNSNTSLASLLTAKRKDSTCVKRTYEPALNILNTLANLKSITQGQYNNFTNTTWNTNNSKDTIQRKHLFRQTRGFDECLYYVLTYGSHADIIQFLIYHNDIKAVLNYYLIQQLDRDLFVQYIYLESLRNGWTPQLISQLKEYDNRLVMWRSTLLYTCRYLENQKQYNCLYQLQLLLDDSIRAAMTCVKFYTMQCDNFQQQHLNAQHLHNARLHLQSELELAKWEHVNVDTLKPLLKRCSSRRSSTSSTSTAVAGGGGFNFFTLKMDARSLNFHINTIVKQMEVAKFLANCEGSDDTDRPNNTLITKNILKQIRNEMPKVLPTLFDNTQEKIEICILLLLCGKNFEEGFGLAYRIMQDYKLSPMRVYAATAKYLARNQRLSDVEKLLHCIMTNNEIDVQELDEIIWVAINSADNNYKVEVKVTLDRLVEKIHSIEMRISAHIFLGQLKSAYLLANKYERINDIRKILRHAEAANQIHIKKLCEKKLQIRTSTSNLAHK